jgi:cellulose synthase (UDP-forming)
MGVYALLDLPLRAHVGISLAMMGMGLLLTRAVPTWRLAAVFLSLAASMRYLYWRSSGTLALDTFGNSVASLLLLGAEFYAFTMMFSGYFQTAVLRKRQIVPLDLEPSLLPTVDVLVPTYNEPIGVLRRTLVGCQAMDYPHKTVWVLDDGRREEVRRLAAEFGCRYLTRSNNEGAKAGNLNAALERTEGALIAIFDADHVPVRSFLQLTIGFFLEDAGLALVQTPHHFYNPDPISRNLYMEGILPPEQAFFYYGIQRGNDFWNGAFFCGSCAVLRRTAIEDIGGIPTETVTEDAHASIKMHAAGWRSAYLPIPQAAGLATERYAIHITQRLRWARGMTQIFRREMPLLKPGLSAAQRITYSAAAAHFLFGLPRLIFLVAPALFLIFGLYPLRAQVLDVLLYAIPHLFLAMVCTSAMHGNRRHSFWPEVYETSLAPYTALVTTATLLFPGQAAFKVTPKGLKTAQREYDWRRAWPILFLGALALISLAITPIRMLGVPEERGTTLLVGAWNLYNILVIGAAAFIALERPQRRSEWRIPYDCTVWLRDHVSGDAADPAEGPASSEETWRKTEAMDLSEGGIRIRLWDGKPVAESVDLLLEVEDSEIVALTGSPVNRVEVDNEQLVGIRFNNLSTQQRDQLIRLMFTPPDAWLRDRYRTDAPLRSALSVVGSVLSVILPFGGKSRRPDQGELLTEAFTSNRCTHCGLLDLAGAARCASCGSELPKDAPPFDMDRGRRTPPVQWGAIATGMALIFVSAGLAWGWTPDLDRLAVPTDAPSALHGADRVRYQELVQAHRELRQSYWTFRASLLPGGPALPLSWSEKLFWLQREYGLRETDERSDGLWQAEGAVRGALLTLSQAEKEYRSGASEDQVDEMLDSVHRLLKEAASHMKKGRE